MGKRSVYEVEAIEKVRAWDEVCSDSGRGGIVRAKWTTYNQGGGGDSMEDYCDFDAVEEAIKTTETGRSRSYFRLVAQYGQSFMENLKKTEAHHKDDWQKLIAELVRKIKVAESEKVLRKSA